MGFLLKEALKSLCSNRWSYAVFWKIGHQNPKLLIWEECHYDMSPCTVFSRVPGIESSELLLQEWDQVIQNPKDTCLLINKMMMSNHVHVIGEGLIGRAGFTGDHLWILSKNYVKDIHPPEVLNELYRQFSAGMQTVAVIPVLPHGVVQFGSSFSIIDNFGFVHEVKNLILQLGYIPGALFTQPESLPNSGDPLSFSSSPINPFGNYLASNSVHLDQSLNIKSQLKSEFTEVEVNYKPDVSQVSTISDSILRFSEAPILLDDVSNYPVTSFPCFLSETQIDSNEFQRSKHKSGDLFDVLGVDLKNMLLNKHCNNSPRNNEADLDTGNLCKGTSTSESGIFSSICSSDQLLDSVVTNMCSYIRQNKNENVSSQTTLINASDLHVPRKSLASCKFIMPNKLEETRILGLNPLKSGCSLKRDSSSVLTLCSKETEENSKSSRKRVKPGETSRPRPKDRQMIQDRVKELREIVPNGAKCSIDALLEKTIKHMLFLQSVTKHADKLQQSDESKITSKNGGVLLKDNFEGGATWAFEVGSQSMVCPIIVEDMNVPHQMLVEVLCEERGFFLELADTIRRIGLTILKGMMEVQNDKVWARFAVEANGEDISRMDVFFALIGLLEQTSNTNAIDADNMMVQNSFNQLTSIPASGMPIIF